MSVGEREIDRERESERAGVREKGRGREGRKRGGEVYNHDHTSGTGEWEAERKREK